MTYQKVASYEAKKGEVKRVLLLYSGGLDTSVMLKWVRQEYGAEVIALTVDIGQIADDLEAIKKKAIDMGAEKAYVIDAKSEFCYNYIAHGIKANARYQGDYHLATPLGRPLIGKLAVEYARREGCDAIAHGCTGKGNDQIRLEGTILTLAPDMKIIAPIREWNMGREEEIEYARQNGVPVPHTLDKIYSYDDNMWGISAEGGEIENPALEPRLERILQTCTPIEKTPNEPDTCKIGFLRGIPVQLDGEDLDMPTMIARLNKRAARHGVGIVTHVEDRVIGLKIRNVYESPAAHTIIRAHEELEHFVCTRQENEFKTTIDQKWAYLCYGGMWLEPLMEDLNAFIDRINHKVTGVVTVKLFKGRADVLSMQTPNTIFSEDLATFMKSTSFNQNISAGFIEAYTMQMRLSRETERYALVSIGGNENKKNFLPLVRELSQMGFILFATTGTQAFLADNQVKAISVNKVSETGKRPNLSDLMRQNRFDIVVNVPTPNSEAREASDGSQIRQWAVTNNTQLVTRLDVLEKLIEVQQCTGRENRFSPERAPALL
jgi:argininosuccinate synthase